MSIPEQPRLRRVESFPLSRPDGEVVFALRDPEGFSGDVVIPYPAAVLASLMDGTRTLPDIQNEFARRSGQPVALEDIEQLVRDLDARLFLDTEQFRARWKTEIAVYLNSPLRAAAHAGRAYPAEPEALRQHLSALFTAEKGPGQPVVRASEASTSTGLMGVVSPQLDLRGAGTAMAFAYKRVVEESDADLFVIFGTAHSPMRYPFSVTRKDFETPLGTVETDRQFAARLAAGVATAPGGREWNAAADELAHRNEHSIEFQTVFLQYLLGGVRPFKILPVLVGSFGEWIAAGKSPADSAEFAAFVSALQKTAQAHAGRIFTIASADLAHVGQRYGDRSFLDAERLRQQATSDRRLLEAACRADAGKLFHLVAAEKDGHRITGLPPIYALLETVRPRRGELLKYDQAVELDGTACVSFASLAFYTE